MSTRNLELVSDNKKENMLKCTYNNSYTWINAYVGYKKNTNILLCYINADVVGNG